MTSCVLCGARGDRLTDEDVIPKWALRALNVQGAITIGVREEAAEQQHVRKRHSFKVVLDDGLCPTCNNVRLSQRTTPKRYDGPGPALRGARGQDG